MFEINYDDLGPEKVMHLYSPKTQLRAMVVVDNTALGPSVGGVRVSPTVTMQEVLRLARTMTMKNSIAGLPHGGGKAGIIADSKKIDKERYFRTFAREIRDLVDYIPGPDMGSDEDCMAWIHDEIGRATGLPREIGGLPLDKIGATGYGIAECAEIACPYAGLNLKGSRVAIQGFGSVGRAAAGFLSGKGAVIVAASDTGGTIYNPEGLDVAGLLDIKRSTGSVINYENGTRKRQEDLFLTDCEILIPAATPDVIHKDNVRQMRAKLILQGANIPATQEAELILHELGILSVPDFIANAGGVIMAAMEYAKKIEREALEAISSKIRTNTQLVIEKAKKENLLPRRAAESIARERVLSAMRYREF
jgi:glutamate dehydrogenase/leucine dehydrogenase